MTPLTEDAARRTGLLSITYLDKLQRAYQRLKREAVKMPSRFSRSHY